MPTNENVQMKQASAATFQKMELARNCYRSLHLKFVFNLILLKVIVILQYLVINLILITKYDDDDNGGKDSMYSETAFFRQ